MTQQVLESQTKVALIIPCFNEANRLHFDIFKNYQKEMDFFFVDDASTDDTFELIKKNGFPCFRLDSNIGKGPAIRQGLHHFKENLKTDEYQWIGYWDADLSIPLENIALMLEKGNKNIQYSAVWASRHKRFSQSQKTSFIRKTLGKSFSIFVRTFLNIPINDTQCGAKIFRAPKVFDYFNEPFISRWIFDVEIFYRMIDEQICEHPIEYWENQDHSRFSFIKDGFEAIYDLIKIKKKYTS